MGNNPPTVEYSLSLEAKERIDRICLTFEEAWRIGTRPLAEAFLGDTTGAERSVLLMELLLLDLDYRQRLGELPTAEEYRIRFPQNDDLIEAVFQRFEQSDATVSFPTPVRDDMLGACLGPYKLLSILGEGGFGIVYLADQEKPIRRRVALKILKAGLDTKQILARFEAERQTLAMMDHTNIARVFDAGTTENGRSYFVMELVRGEPITAYCDSYKLALEQRLGLFMTVCQAVQHAHQKGIIHRDIKPSNVLVTVVDDHPVPKIIDFGLAKAMARPLSEQSIFTEQGQLLGTPEYMSPEQAGMTNLDVDTRSDIYSLGVLLYELLTGTLPFDRRMLRQAGFDEIRRIIREMEPPKPSTRISTLGKDSQDCAGNRRTDSHSLCRRLRQELDWIVMKTLEKDRTRRYATATALAEDIQHYLQYEPVHAGPPGNWYRIRRFARRFRLPLSIVAGFAAFLVAITLLAIRGYYREKDLRNEAEVSRQNTENALKKSAALQQAEKNLYGNRIALAHQKLLNSEVDAADQELDACPPQFRSWEWNYLKRLCHLDLLTLRGHICAVCSVAFSPDGKRLFSGGHDRTVKTWNAVSGQELLTFGGHTSHVASVACSPDGKRMVSGSWDHTVKIWDAASDQELLTLQGHSAQVYAVAYSPDGNRVASGSLDQTVKIWDAASGQVLHTLPGDNPAFKDMIFYLESLGKSVDFSPDGKRLASGYDKIVKIWDVVSGQELLNLQGHSHRVTCVVFSPDGKRLASGSLDQTVKIWDSASGQVLLTLQGHSAGVSSVAYSPDGKRLAAGYSDKTVKIWDAVSGQELLILRGHSAAVRSVAFSPDGKRLASGSEDSTVKLWDAVSGQELLALPMHYYATHFYVAFAPDGKRLASESQSWDAASGQEVITLPIFSGQVCTVAYSPDGKRLASGSLEKLVKIWDAASGHDLLTLCGHSAYVACVAYSPDGKRLASGSKDNTVIIWDAVSGRELLTLAGHSAEVYTVAYGPDGKRLASGSADNSVKIWDAASGRELLTLRGHSAEVLTVAFSPDGKRLASGSQDKTVKIWDAVNGQELLTLHGHSAQVFSVAFSPDGKRLATGSDDSTVKIWDAANGQELLTLREHSAAVRSVAFSPDGKRLASGSCDNIVKIWDAESVQERHYTLADEKWKEDKVGSLTSPKQSIDSLDKLFHAKKVTEDAAKSSWSPDGGKLVVGKMPWYNGLKIIDIQTGEVQQLLDFGKDPAWSPGEGRWIAFTRGYAPDEEVWIIEPSGNNSRKIAEGGYPSWSADGKTLFFHSHQQNKVLSIQPDETEAPLKEVCDMPSFYPSISPGGSQICYADRSNMHILDLKTKKETYSVPLPSTKESFCSWLPDGKRIGLGVNGSIYDNCGCWIFNLETKAYKKIVSGPYIMPVWSPDGSKIAIDVRDNDHSEIWVIGVDRHGYPESRKK